MTHTTTRIIRQEHSALSAMLRSILLLLGESRQHNKQPDFSSIRAMLFYVDEFPEKRHHLKESQLFFPKIRERSPLAGAVLDRLDQDHERGERAIRKLEHSLLEFEMLGEARRETFELAARQYVEFYLTHMALEEDEILPLAEKCLTEQDWIEIDKAFSENRDPLTGYEPDDLYRDLFKRIVNSVPEPIGLRTNNEGNR